MADQRTGELWIVVVLAVLLIIGSYVGAFFWRSQLIDFADSAEPTYVRLYASEWEALLFRPAAMVEALVTGRQVASAPLPEVILR